MKLAIIIFVIISSIFSLGSLTYVTVDWVYEKVKGTPSPQPVPVPVAAPAPIPQPEAKPEPVAIPIVEEINAEQADVLISDAVALSSVLIEDETAPDGFKTFINIGDINDAFKAGDTVTVAELIQKKLIPAKSRRLKILAHGVLNKPLTVKANSFSVQAVKMIELTGGTVVLRKVKKK